MTDGRVNVPLPPAVNLLPRVGQKKARMKNDDLSKLIYLLLVRTALMDASSVTLPAAEGLVRRD